MMKEPASPKSKKKPRQIQLLNTEEIGQKHFIVHRGHKVYLWELNMQKFITHNDYENHFKESTIVISALNLENAYKKLAEFINVNEIQLKPMIDGEVPKELLDNPNVKRGKIKEGYFRYLAVIYNQYIEKEKPEKPLSFLKFDEEIWNNKFFGNKYAWSLFKYFIENETN